MWYPPGIQTGHTILVRRMGYGFSLSVEQEGPWPRPGGGVKTKRRAPRRKFPRANLRCLAQRAWRPPRRERGRGAAGGGKAQGLAHENLHVRPWVLALPEEAREFGRWQERRGIFAVVLTVPGGG